MDSIRLEHGFVPPCGFIYDDFIADIFSKKNNFSIKKIDDNNYILNIDFGIGDNQHEFKANCIKKLEYIGFNFINNIEYIYSFHFNTNNIVVESDVFKVYRNEILSSRSQDNLIKNINNYLHFCEKIAQNAENNKRNHVAAFNYESSAEDNSRKRIR